jgi:putative membrane-bound dehydrogenase-like protein
MSGESGPTNAYILVSRNPFPTKRMSDFRLPSTLVFSALALGFAAAPLHAAPRPVRIAYVDVQGVERTKKGLLNDLMRELGRDALFFDYYGIPADFTPELAGLYDSAVVLGDGASIAALSSLKERGRVLQVTETSTPAQVREAVLQMLPPETRKQWEAFLAQREPEVREKSDNVANYEKRSEPLTFQKPYSVKGSMERTQVPADTRLELFASEPDIGKPIAMAWDAKGRCWVACTSDYPHGVSPDNVGNDKIIICEDSNGDGKADKFTVFADKLNIPTGLCFANGGLIVSQPPNFVFLKDTNGDDKADVREVLLSGWGIGDTHAQASNLHHGYDNWLYGAVGYSGFNGMVQGKQMEFRMGSYRFRKDGSQLQFLHQFSNNTWAQSYNDAGDNFGGTANNAPIFYGGIPATALPTGKVNSATRINAVMEAHPITPNFRQVDVMGGYTAAAGSAFVYSAGLPERMQGRALICEPTMKLVALMDIRPEGAGYRALDQMNVFASTDEWASPVYAEVGPDGAIWIADWQNFIIQHNPTPSPERGGYKATTGVGGAHENPLRDHERGRIYRIVANKSQPGKRHAIDPGSTESLVRALESDIQYTRLQAQHLLVEGKRADAIPALKKMVIANKGETAAIHALWALEGLGGLDAETHKAALYASDARLRRNAIRALGTDPASQALFHGSGVIADPEPHTRLAAWVRLADFPTTPEIQKLVRGLSTDPATKSDEWLREASRVLGKRHSTQTYTEGPNLLPNPGLETLGATGFPEGWTRRDYNKASGPEFATWQSTSDKAAVHSGQTAFKVTSKDKVDTSFHADVPIKPGTDYKLSAWVRGKGLKGKISLNDHIGRHETEKLTRDAGWTEVETVFNSGDKKTASINLLFVGSGEAIFDDVKLVELLPVTEAPLLAADPKRGELLFLKHPTAACILCHALKGQGSNVGPALDGIAARKDASYIRQSLLEPNAVLAQGFEYLKVSPMPPMGLILSSQELEDVQAFLQTLK